MIWDFKKTFVATQTYFITAVAIALFIFFIEFSPAILSVLGRDTGTINLSQGLVSTILLKISETPRAADLITVFIWGFAGLGVYMLYLFVANIKVKAQNELIMATDNSQRGISPRIVQQRARNKIIGVIGYTLLAVLTVVLFFGVWMDLLRIFVISGMELAKTGYFISGILALIINIYAMITLGLLLWRYVNTTYQYY